MLCEVAILPHAVSTFPLGLATSYLCPFADKKFHLEHFTCSLCPTLFGPQDSYYEHDGDAYCHFHYSTRFAAKCAGCNSAILKQIVEINRNMRDECWHPECYMINKVCRSFLDSSAQPLIATRSFGMLKWFLGGLQVPRQ
jgi:LIM domain